MIAAYSTACPLQTLATDPLSQFAISSSTVSSNQVRIQLLILISVVLPEKGNTNAMKAYAKDEEQRDISASLRRKQQIYKELPKDRSGRDGMFGKNFYEKAEQLDAEVCILPNSSNLCQLLL